MAIIIRWKRWQVLDVYQKEEVTHLPVYRTVAAVAPQPEKGRTVAIDISPLLLLSISLSLSLFSSRFYVHTQPSSAARKKKKRNLQLWKMIEISSGWNKHPRQNEIQKFCVSFFFFFFPLQLKCFFFLKRKSRQFGASRGDMCARVVHARFTFPRRVFSLRFVGYHNFSCCEREREREREGGSPRLLPPGRVHTA